MSDLYELHLKRLGDAGFLDENVWGVKGATGDGGQPPPANGGRNTTGGKGKGRGGSGGRGKKKPMPPWMTENGKKDGWGTETGRQAHETWHGPMHRGRDNGIRARMTHTGPPDHSADIRRHRGHGVSDISDSDSRVRRVAREEWAQGIPKPGLGSAAGNPYTGGAGSNGYSAARSRGGGSLPAPGNIRKRRPHTGTGGQQAGNPYVAGSTRQGQDARQPRPGNLRSRPHGRTGGVEAGNPYTGRSKSLWDYAPEEVAGAMEVLEKALGGVLADIETGPAFATDRA